VTIPIAHAVTTVNVEQFANAAAATTLPPDQQQHKHKHNNQQQHQNNKHLKLLRQQLLPQLDATIPTVLVALIANVVLLVNVATLQPLPDLLQLHQMQMQMLQLNQDHNRDLNHNHLLGNQTPRTSPLPWPLKPLSQELAQQQHLRMLLRIKELET
jgi:hypothetical protein